mmetsp:Transcript_7489/g.18357  ORF Transcript_7489/g.18357 Transcript_7489/m.18357 type:complete len:489 (+) Transcript_7489:60-1526(+)
MSFRGLAVVPITIAVVLKGATETSCFVPTPIHPCLNQQHAPVRFESIPASPSCVQALVYGADGSVVGDDVFENPDDKGIDDNLLDALKTAVADPTVWNIIACAFAPPPHDKLTPELVQNANPVGVTENSIDIAVAVPASEQGVAAANQLVQILVTVSFPQAWALPKNAFHDAKVEALLGQVRVLEGLAEARLSQQRNSSFPSRDDPDYYEKMLIEQKWQRRLEEEIFSDSFPEWWTAIEPPFSPLEFREEAALLKKLLNEDEFEDELRALFVEHGKISSNSPLVYRASVSSVGSSGLFLKARVARESDVNKKQKETEILASAAIPYSNPPKEVRTTGELREGVLVLVESVTPMPMPAIPQAKPDSIESDGETITPFNEQVVEMVTERERETAEMEDNESKDDEEETTQTTEEDTEQEPEVGSPPEATIESETKATSSEESSGPEKVRDTLSRQQPLPPEEEAKLAAKYAAIEDLGERAFAILRDLGMV